MGAQKRRRCNGRAPMWGTKRCAADNRSGLSSFEYAKYRSYSQYVRNLVSKTICDEFGRRVGNW